METNPTADESTAAAPGAQPTENHSPRPEDDSVDEAGVLPNGTGGPEDDELVDLAKRAQAGRLPAKEEERAGALLKETLLGGKAGIARAVEALPNLPWIVGVRAVETAWPELKPTAKTQLLKSLAENESDGARRVRLSLARALFKQDVPIALKIATAVAREMREAETGALSPRHAQIFANVFIGKAKPWLAQLPLAELKPADADALVQCAILAVFSLAHPPLTQLGVLKWAGEAGHLAKLDDTATGIVARGVSRWSTKWQATLRREVPDLPDEIARELRATAAQPSLDRAETDEEVGAPTAVGETERWEEATIGEVQEDVAPKKERPIYEPRPQKHSTAPELQTGRAAPAQQRKERPLYQPRPAGTSAQNLNLAEVLRQIEAHVQWLRSALNAAQAKLREEEESRRSKRRSDPGSIVIEGQPTPEELARTNQQLEARIAELQQRVDDLMADAEDRAASIGAVAGEEVTDGDVRLRTLLGLKLQENFQDFVALEQEMPSVVVQQHYKSLLQEVFAVLRQEGVPLKE